MIFEDLMVFAFFKNNFRVWLVIAGIGLWFAAGYGFVSETFNDKVSAGVFLRILGSWFFPLLLSVLWLKKDALQKLLAKYAFYVFIFVFGIGALCIFVLLLTGALSCEWAGKGLGEAVRFYYLLLLPALHGVEIALSLLIAAVFSLVSAFMNEKWFGVFEGKKNKTVLLVLLYLWVTFLPNLIQFSSVL